MCKSADSPSTCPIYIMRQSGEKNFLKKKMQIQTKTVPYALCKARSTYKLQIFNITRRIG